MQEPRAACEGEFSHSLSDSYQIISGVGLKLESDPLIDVFGVPGGEIWLSAESQFTLFCFPSGLASNPAHVERRFLSHSYAAAVGYYVLLKTKEDHTSFKSDVSECLGLLFKINYTLSIQLAQTLGVTEFIEYKVY